MRSLKILAYLGVAISLLVCFLLWVMFSDQSSFSSGLSSYADLPDAATNIAVFENANISGLRLIEFSIPERDFELYATSQGWNMSQLSETKFVISASDFHQKKKNYYIEVSDGLFFEDRRANGGGVTVIYDRKNQLAFIKRSSR